MVSATNTKLTELASQPGARPPSAAAEGAGHASGMAPLGLPHRLDSRRYGGALLIGNTLALILLVFAALGIMAYRDGILDARAAIVERQALMIQAALSPNALAACGDVNCLIRRADAQRVLEAASPEFAGQLALFRLDGDPQNALLTLMAEYPVTNDITPTAMPIPERLPASALSTDFQSTFWDWFERAVVRWPLQHRLGIASADEHALAIALGSGNDDYSIQLTDNDRVVVTKALPIVEGGEMIGVLVAQSQSVDAMPLKLRGALLPTILLTFAVASFSAIVLTAAVTQPLRKLSAAAERVRSSVGRAGQVKLPNFDHRRDDIGRLSRSFRTMIKALVDRIESIDSFAADVSHELKNPLTSIRSAVETFDKCQTDEQRRRLLDVITVDVERMDRLISDISSASRLDAQLATETRTAVLASKFIGDVARSYKAVSDAGGPRVNFWDDTDGQAVLHGAPAALGRVLRNLIDNAVSFSPPSGAVTVALEKQTRKRQNYVLMTVTDEGPGVPEDNLESIFDRFYTSRPQGATFGSNSGLGLAIARQIVESHGGTIWAENTYSEGADAAVDGPSGARFHVKLPIHREGLR